MKYYDFMNQRGYKINFFSFGVFKSVEVKYIYILISYNFYRFVFDVVVLKNCNLFY